MKKDEFTAETFKAAFPEIHEEIYRAGFHAGASEGIKEGHEKGLAAGADAERERIRGVEKIAVPGHEALIGELKFDGKTTGPEAAVKVLEAEAALRKTKQESFVADAPKPATVAEAPADRKPDVEAEEEKLPLEQKAKNRWDRSPELRDEFFMGGFKSYLAYLKNEKNVRIFEKK
jgi:hypothetical protein